MNLKIITAKTDEAIKWKKINTS